jgi:sugar lactone lactonase YvrE
MSPKTIMFVSSLLRIAPARCCLTSVRQAFVCVFIVGGLLGSFPMTCVAQEANAPAPAAATEPKYPISVAVDGGKLYVVDLDLPGVWQVVEGKRELFVLGTKLLRKPMNRPRCIALHPDGGILVGDSATREVYHIAQKDAEPKPLCQARIGIAMAIAVSPDKKSFYVGDAEKRAVFRLPIEGGEPELIARVNARGLAFDQDGALWAVTPDDAAVHRIDVAAKTNTPVITGRPYQYPNGLVWAGDHGFVTDGYGKAIWKFTADGKTEAWFTGEPLVGPVGLAIDDQSIWVADPKKLQVFKFDRTKKEPQPSL